MSAIRLSRGRSFRARIYRGQYCINDHLVEHTFSRFGGLLSCAARLFERSPFEGFPVASAYYITFLTLLAGRFDLVTFKTLCLAGDTACSLILSIVVQGRIGMKCRAFQLADRLRRTIAALGLFLLGDAISL